MKVSSVLCLIGVGVIVASCGGDSGGSSSSSGKKRISKSPIKLKKQIESCEGVGVFSNDEDINFYIDQFVSGITQNLLINFNGMLSRNFVESYTNSPITDSYYGLETYEEFHALYVPELEDYIYKPGAKRVDKKKISEASYLSVCPSTYSYERNTFESSGLNINYSITKTYENVKKADTSISLEGVTVQVAPLRNVNITIKGGPYDGRDRFGFETDNASYNPQSKEITFLPQSKEYQAGTGSKVAFWEIPMVASHEYGHHIFQTLIKDKINSSSEIISGCFHKGKIEKLMEIKNASSSLRDNGVGFALGSMNEGFADLISFYSLSQQERSLLGVPCFEKNRVVNFPTFGGGTMKYFSTEGLSLINSKTSSVNRKSCNDPDFQEIHDVGAVFAHQVDSIFERRGFLKSEKLKYILVWAKKFAEKYESLASLESGEVFFAAIELLHKVINDAPAGRINASTCTDMNDSFEIGHGYSCRYLRN